MTQALQQEVEASVFDAAFKALTDSPPFPWQRRLFDRMVKGNWPDACDIPTGLGKTSAVTCWLIALAYAAPNTIPRRLVYVVNRRTIVDQVTDVAETLRARLIGATQTGDKSLIELRNRLLALAGYSADANVEPLAISTLRGELADNGAWRRDPARPSIIVATPDLAGSSMLFRAYRTGWKSRAFYAGLLGHDALVLHDEAHLTRPFQALLRRIRELQESHDKGASRNLRVMALSATGDDEPGEMLRLNDDDHNDPIVERRLQAKKLLYLHESAKLVDDVAAKALEFADRPVRVLVYLRSPKDAAAVAKKLRAAAADADRVELLTGTIRGLERDQLAHRPVMCRLRRTDKDLPPLEKAVYLVSTSAGEVGVDLDADHLVCDLTPADSLVQRLGRVNRRGEFIDGSEVHVFADGKVPDALKEAVAATKQMLVDLGASPNAGIPAGPLATREWVSERTRPRPGELAYLTDAGLSALTMTSIRNNWSLVPDVPALIHGLEDDEPQTIVVWREEVELLGAVEDEEIEAVFTVHHTLAHERLTAPSVEVAQFIKHRLLQWQRERREAGERDGPPFAIIRNVSGNYARVSLDTEDLADRLRHAMLILPASFGGLDMSGSLDAHKAAPKKESLDVADLRLQDDADEYGPTLIHSDTRARIFLTRRPDETWVYRRLGTGDGDSQSFESRREARAAAISSIGTMRVEHEIVIGRHPEDETPQQFLLLLQPRRKGRAQGGGDTVGYHEHVEHVKEYVDRFANALVPDLHATYVAAASFHDSGKRRDLWQRAAGRRDSDPLLAKPAGVTGLKWRLLNGYRHEFGSAWDIINGVDVSSDVDRELLLHLVLSHHARGRPSFAPAAFFDPDHGTTLPPDLTAAAIARRFVKLQRRYGPWRLAWLEAILIAADRAASADEQGGDDGSD